MKTINKQEYDFLNNNKQQKEEKKAEIKQNFSKLVKILIYIFLAPFLIIGFFFVECAREASRANGRGRRR